MNMLGKFFGLVLGLALFAALAAAGYFALRILLSLFADLEPAVAKVTAVGAVVALLAAALIASAIREAGRKARAAGLLAQKAGAYVDFLAMEAKSAQGGQEAAVEDLERRLRLLGSAGTLRAILELRAAQAGHGSHHPQVKALRARVMAEMRRDIGADGLSTRIGDGTADAASPEEALVATGWLR
ncbi:MAG TPA: hypothetical protein VHB46_01865 [Burkholderiales bacterium]|nr:hypothetical protein [Burkholderiales bacterium]